LKRILQNILKKNIPKKAVFKTKKHRMASYILIWKHLHLFFYYGKP